MACVVLPSETARLVYGYLVKEKLDNIAMQFLEHSPYLTDCYHIVKSGYQFNTKFLYKELHELIQEFSTIQNLVNRKVGLLSKTSPLYKRIKLHCENLSEIIESFLFLNNESNSEGDTPAKSRTQILENLTEKKTDNVHEIIINSDSAALLQVSNSNIFGNNDSSNIGSDKRREGRGTEIFVDTDCRLNSKFSADKSDLDQDEINVRCTEETNSKNNVDVGDVGLDAVKKCIEIEASEERTVSEGLKENVELDIDMNQSCTENESNKVEMSLIGNRSDLEIGDEVKTGTIENGCQQNNEKNQLQNVFTQNLDGMEPSLSIDNSSVLYVTPDVGNIINQDRNQIIVIPIDYYKSQNEVGNGQGQTQNLSGNIANTIAETGGIIFEDTSVTSNMPSSTSSNTLSCGTSFERKCAIDENIVTEGTFLKNKDLIYELENKLKPQIFQETTSIQQILPTTAPVSTPLQTYYLTQLIEQPDKGHRRILPKREPPIQNAPAPIVVVQRLAQNCVKTCKTQAKKAKLPGKKDEKKKVKSVKRETKQTNEVLNMPSIRTPVSKKGGDFAPENDTGSDRKAEEPENGDIIETISEEKENLEGNEKKTETPAVIMNKNSKRLSLSTPRRRSHIRALEFETPPKTANEKKSKTSPKIKVDEIKVKNKNVRNTLFKSPDSDVIFKTPSCLKSDKRDSPKLNESATSDKHESPELFQTRSAATNEPNSKSGDDRKVNNAEGGISCAFNKTEKTSGPKKSWDADLRDFIPPTTCPTPDKGDTSKRKRTRKSKKTEKDVKKCSKSGNKQEALSKKCKTPQMLSSPSKMSLTAKRNTYSISGGNEEGSPVRSILEELDLVTPFKAPEPSRSVEETPLTKLFRENVNGLDIDLNMISTPIFPPTPSIIITPDVDDSLSMSGTYYYTPLKDTAKTEKINKIENFKSDFVKMDDCFIPSGEPENEKDKKGTKETQEKVIDELVSKAKEIVGLRRGENEEHAIKKPPTGKVLSMVKIQMITQCDKKLCENIPINEEESMNESSNGDQGRPLIEKIAEEAAKFDLKCELEEKRQRALKKIKSVKENFTPHPKKPVKRPLRKRKRSRETVKFKKKMKRDSACDSSVSDAKTNESSESSVLKEDGEQLSHSTPYPDRGSRAPFIPHSDSSDKIDAPILEEIRQEFPPFRDTGEFPELPVKTRKKLHYIKHFLNTEEVVKYLKSSRDGSKVPKLKLKKCHRKFFQVFYKWLRHPHAREVNVSQRTECLFKEYRTLFQCIKSGISLKIDNEDFLGNKDNCRLPNLSGETSHLISDGDGELNEAKVVKKKEEDMDDGPVSILPLKKRKATVQPSQLNGSSSGAVLTDKGTSGENASRTQTFLQDIDVDRFLSQIHGHENR